MPNFSPLKVCLASLTVMGIIYSSADLVSARGGYGGGSYRSHGGSVHVRGYTRKDGTYVSPYTRSAPGYGSQPSYSHTHNSPIYSAPTFSVPSDSIQTENNRAEETEPDAGRSDTSNIEANTGTSAIEPSKVPTEPTGTETISPFSSRAASNSSEAPAQPKGLPTIPPKSCGDQSSDDKAIWYPVFINNGDVQEIRKKFCADAVLTTRTDTNTPAVQVASFTTRKTALEFAKAVEGEVGQPSTPVELKKAIDQNSNAIQNQSRNDSASFLKPASTITSTPPLISSSTVSQESVSGMLTTGAIGLIGFGIWRKFRLT
jgi:hypothetical protein